MFNVRKPRQHAQTSYTGVSAFSADPAPSTGALAAAQAIGDALRANNNDPTNMQLPPTQLKRSGSLMGIARAQPPPAHGRPLSRSTSLRSVSAQRGPVSSYRSGASPQLASRRSVSDMSSIQSKKEEPKFIKRYVPGPNGLQAVEVPNPKHPDNMSPQQLQQHKRAQSMRKAQLSQRRSSSLQSVTRSQSRVLPDGSRVETVTTEKVVYIPENDEYHGFDDDNQSYSSVQYTPQPSPTKFMDNIKEDEEQELGQNDVPIHEDVVFVANTTIDETHIEEEEEEENNDLQPQEPVLQSQTVEELQYSQEEKDLAQKKLNELVEQKEKELLDQMIKQNQFQTQPDNLSTSSTKDEAFEEAPELVTVPLSGNSMGESIVSDVHGSSQSSNQELSGGKSMAQYLRTTLQPQQQEQEQKQQPNQRYQVEKEEELVAVIPEQAAEPIGDPVTEYVSETIVEPIEQSVVEAEKVIEPVELPVAENIATKEEPAVLKVESKEPVELKKRKSVLKNRNSNYNINIDTMSTAENTRMNARGSSINLSLPPQQQQQQQPQQQQQQQQQQSRPTYNQEAMHTAAVRATNIHSNQAVEAPPTQKKSSKVEDAKRRILSNSPAQQKAKELYRLSKSRPMVTENQLKSVSSYDPIPRRSSFEKLRDEAQKNQLQDPKVPDRSSKRLTLRDEVDLQSAPQHLQQQQQSHQQNGFSVNSHPTVNNHTSGNGRFKSRFSNDSDSDYDIPIVSKGKVMGHTSSQSLAREQAHISAPAEDVAANGSEATPKVKKESKFQKLFMEPANKRYTSTSSHATQATQATVDGEKKKSGGFKKLKKLFGSSKK